MLRLTTTSNALAVFLHVKDAAFKDRRAKDRRAL